MQKMSYYGLSTFSSTSPKTFLRRPEADYEFKGPFANLKHHWNDFTQVAFFDAKASENELVWPFDTSKYRFIDFTKAVF
jgi:hypothetical protein